MTQPQYSVQKAENFLKVIDQLSPRGSLSANGPLL